jgi:hypothetical protein
MILVIVGRRTEEQCLIREVGIGSNSQFISGDCDNSLETSSIVTAVKDEKLRGMKGGGIWKEVRA